MFRVPPPTPNRCSTIRGKYGSRRWRCQAGQRFSGWEFSGAAALLGGLTSLAGDGSHGDGQGEDELVDGMHRLGVRERLRVERRLAATEARLAAIEGRLNGGVSG